LHLFVECWIFIWITVDNKCISLKLLSKYSELHVVPNYYGTVERMFQDLGIAGAS